MNFDNPAAFEVVKAGRHWAVVQGDDAVTFHPTKKEAAAEAAAWERRREEFRAEQAAIFKARLERVSVYLTERDRRPRQLGFAL